MSSSDDLIGFKLENQDHPQTSQREFNLSNFKTESCERNENVNSEQESLMDRNFETSSFFMSPYQQQQTIFNNTKLDQHPLSQVQQCQSTVPYNQNVRLPSFWKCEPKLWFIHIEAIFHTQRIYADNDRYFAVLTAIEDPGVLSQIADFIYAPPKEDKYLALKNLIITRFYDSPEQQLNKLFNELSLGDKKPSQLLREILKLTPTGTPEVVIMSLWMKCMPASVRCILAASQGIEIKKLAEIADKIIDNSSATNSISVASISNHHQNVAINIRLNKLEERLDDILKLVQEPQYSSSPQDSQTQRVSTQRDAIRQRSLSPRKQTAPKLCFYHQKFGPRARHCIKPCSFNATQSENLNSYRRPRL